MCAVCEPPVIPYLTVSLDVVVLLAAVVIQRCRKVVMLVGRRSYQCGYTVVLIVLFLCACQLALLCVLGFPCAERFLLLGQSLSVRFGQGQSQHVRCSGLIRAGGVYLPT